MRQDCDAHRGIAFCGAARLQALADEMRPTGARALRPNVADACDAASLRAMAQQSRVLFNFNTGT
jgi:hypothetical protein